MKLKNLLLVSALGFIALACTKKPADVVNDVYSKADKKEFSKILPYIVPDSVSDFTDLEKQMFEKYLTESLFNEEGDQGPLYSSFTISCEEPTDDSDRVTFTVNTQLTNGMSYNEEGTLLKGKDGKWRLALVNAPNDTTSLFSVSDIDNKTPELMRNLKYAYIMTMATRGLPEFQTKAAYYYYWGTMTFKDLNKYFELIKNAADKGYPEALIEVGNAYLHGNEGVTQDLEKSVEYWEKAANAGDANAMYKMGWAYDMGSGVIKDYQKAMEWYKKAVDKGYYFPLNNMAVMYENGEGVEKDENKAFELYKEAAEKGNTMAMKNLSLFYQNGKAPNGKDMNKAIEWSTKSAEGGEIYGMTNLADIYYNGTGGTETNYDKAFYWYKKAADKGDNYATYMIGQCYQYGRGVDRNLQMAADWYNKIKSKYKPAADAFWMVQRLNY